MLIVETMKEFLALHNLDTDYRVQPYVWDEKKDSEQQKYLVIQPVSGGSSTLEDEVDNVRLLLVGAVRGNKLELNNQAELIKKALVENHTMNDVWYFDIVGRPMFMQSKELRPIFELNITCNKVV